MGLFTQEEQAAALERVRGRTTLPVHRILEVFGQALRHVEANPATAGAEPMERVILLAAQQLWTEEHPGKIRRPDWVVPPRARGNGGRM